MRVFGNCTIALAFVFLALLGIQLSGQSPLKPAIVKLQTIAAKNSVFNQSSRQKPLTLNSIDEAHKVFEPAEVKTLQSKVDFSKQVVMIFAWRGSGQDKLEFSVLESFPEQIQFKYVPGRTRDLRSHVALFAVRSNVLWKGKPVGKTNDDKASKEYVKVEVQGKLDSQVFAIGAETTGVQITANGITWELDLRNDKKLMRLAKELDGQQVVVTGELRSKKGVEIRQRWIVDVASMKASGQQEEKAASRYMDQTGKLTNALVVRDGQSGFAGVSGELWSIETDGSWRVQSFLNRTVQKATRKGQLTPNQLKELAAALENLDLLGLPDVIGKPPEVNPHSFTTTFGNKSTSIHLRGGESLPTNIDGLAKGPRKRFVEVILLVKRVMGK